MDDMATRYDKIIRSIFEKYYVIGTTRFEFARDEIIHAAEELQLPRPKNPGDIPYSYRYRRQLPKEILDTAPDGYEWLIRSVGVSRYQFALAKIMKIVPSENYLKTKVPDATPGIIRKYAVNDEQALLAILRYNRLIDIFSGITCYSLQNHLRTTVKNMGQVETDELYVGIDKHGAHYIIPVQAKGGNDRIGPVQIEQDFALCEEKYPALICRPIAAQFMNDGAIALFGFVKTDEGIRISLEKHYQLVPPEELTASEIATYRGVHD